MCVCFFFEADGDKIIQILELGITEDVEEIHRALSNAKNDLSLALGKLLKEDDVSFSEGMQKEGVPEELRLYE